MTRRLREFFILPSVVFAYMQITALHKIHSTLNSFAHRSHWSLSNLSSFLLHFFSSCRLPFVFSFRSPLILIARTFLPTQKAHADSSPRDMQLRFAYSQKCLKLWIKFHCKRSKTWNLALCNIQTPQNIKNSIFKN